MVAAIADNMAKHSLLLGVSHSDLSRVVVDIGLHNLAAGIGCSGMTHIRYHWADDGHIRKCSHFDLRRQPLSLFQWVSFK
jgi:hypothetical protein